MDYVLQALWARPVLNLENPHVLRSNLLFLYSIIRATENLLHAAILASQGPLRDYFMKHLKEEEGHAQLLLQDLENLEVTEFPVSFTAAALAGSQYYYIFHHHPAMLLGYMAVLECAPMHLRTVDFLESLHGPLKCLRLHSEVDPHHGAELLRMIDSQPPQLQKGIAKNAEDVAGVMRTYLENLRA